MRQFLKNKLPKLAEISKIKVLQKLNITHRYLWSLSRKNVAPAFFIGLFWTMLPIPFQMVPATVSAIYFRANLPLTLILVWISNPITMPFILYLNYQLGVFLLSMETVDRTSFYSLETILTITNPLILGSVISGLFFGLVGYILVNWIYIRFIRQLQNKRVWRKNTGKIKANPNKLKD